MLRSFLLRVFKKNEWRFNRQALLASRIVLVLGGGGTLGRAFAAAVPAGTIVINVSRRSALEGENVINISYDLRQDLEPLFDRLACELPHIDALITMAYATTYRPVAQLDEAAFLDETRLDVVVPTRAALLCLERFWSALPRQDNMRARRRIIHLSSHVTFGKASRPELATYGATKTSLNHLTQYLHDYAWSTAGVSAHVVAPASFTDRRRLDATVETLIALLESNATPEFSLVSID